MDNTRRDALKPLSRVTTKTVAKSAELLVRLAGAGSSDPGDLKWSSTFVPRWRRNEYKTDL
jgi:hypothetical protein